MRVPVFIGHSEAVNVEFEQPITAEEARDILREAPGCLVVDKPARTAATSRRYECAGEDATYISRIREDQTLENGLSMWIVSDNLRKGAATERRADRRAAAEPRPDRGEERRLSQAS